MLSNKVVRETVLDQVKWSIIEKANNMLGQSGREELESNVVLIQI
jgi:hypothetical protein